MFEISDETEDGPVVCPEAEGLVVGVGFEGEVGFSEGDDDYDSVVNEAGEEFLHGLMWGVSLKFIICL